MGAMARRKRKPSDPPPVAVDLGPDTLAQRAGAVYDDARTLRDYQVLGKRRKHMLEIMHEREVITERQKDAGLRLHSLWCRTFLTAEKNGIFVDRTPDPALSAAVQADRISRYKALSQHVPFGCRLAVMTVARDNLPLSGPRGLVPGGRVVVTLAKQLREGLDALADELGY